MSARPLLILTILAGFGLGLVEPRPGLVPLELGGAALALSRSLAGVSVDAVVTCGRARFREVGIQAGLESAYPRHGLGAQFLDVNGDGRPDLYVADDEDPNQLYVNVPWPGGVKADPQGLGFRFEERGAAAGVADPYAGMGVASSTSPTGGGLPGPD